MSSYYKWDADSEDFVAVPASPAERAVEPAYRLATERDRSAILDFEAEYERAESQSFLRATGFYDFRTGVWSADLGAHEHSSAILAILNNKVVGELSMSCYDDTLEGVKVGVIRGLCVLRQYRQNGIGRALFHHARDQFRRWGSRRIELMYGLRNRADEEFCRRVGFEITRAGQAVYRLE